MGDIQLRRVIKKKILQLKGSFIAIGISFIKAYEGYRQDKNNSKKMNAMISSLPYIDWGIFFDKNTGLFFNFLADYREIIEKENKKAIGALLRARRGLDGVMAEGYAGLLGDAILSHPQTMIRQLSKLSDDELRVIINYIVFDMGCKNTRWEKATSKIRDLSFKNEVEQTRRLILKKLEECAE